MNRLNSSNLQVIIHLVFLFIVGQQSWAKFALGSGVTSVTDGRPIPHVYSAFEINSWRVSAVATGSRTSLYYQSGYFGNVMKTSNWGTLLNGNIQVGFGLGAYFTERGYRPTVSSELKKDSDFNGGFAFRVAWYALGPVFLSVESIFGMRNPFLTLLLSAQDMNYAVIGVEL